MFSETFSETTELDQEEIKKLQMQCQRELLQGFLSKKSIDFIHSGNFKLEFEEQFFKILFVSIKLNLPLYMRKDKTMVISESYNFFKEAKTKNIKFFQFQEFIAQKLERNQHNIDHEMVIPNEYQSEVFNKIMPLDKLERSIEFYSTQSYQKETFRSNLTHYSFKKLESPMAAIERKMFE